MAEAPLIDIHLSDLLDGFGPSGHLYCRAPWYTITLLSPVELQACRESTLLRSQTRLLIAISTCY